MKKILFVSSEAVPYVKTGGLADVVGSLPKYFDKKEYDVRVVIPKYACMDRSFLPNLKFLCHFYVNLNWRRQYVGIFESEYHGVHFYFVDNEFYFAGESPYNNIYEDVEKFAYFSKAVLASLPYIDFAPDIIHCNDWQTGLIPVFLHTVFGDDNFYAGIKTVFTIHNLQFQGRWRIQEIMDITGLPAHIFNAYELESYGEANYLKGGVVYADYITTVSETYAQEIQTPQYGEGLDGLLSARHMDLRGIVNGIDYDIWNPETDGKIDTNYSIKDVHKGKAANKRALQEALGLTVDENKMLIGLISRLTDQKGLDLIAEVMEQIVDDNTQFVVIGTGDERYENMFRHYAWKYPNKVSANIYYADEMSHKLYAAADAFLMPSAFEPCGLTQLISFRYGTVPIVRETGGLKDTVEPYNEYEGRGDGFSFTNYNPWDMMEVINYAKYTYFVHRKEWDELVARGMQKDFSWDASRYKYEGIYSWLIGW